MIDPNIIVLLMSLGVLAITVELFNPGLIFPAAFGAISLIIGLFGLQVLPFSWAGILLMLIALGFFVAEAFITSHGALAVAGAVAFVFGALMLFDPAGDAYQVSLPVAIAIGGHARPLRRLRGREGDRGPAASAGTGREEMLGQVGIVREPLDPEGLVLRARRALEGARRPTATRYPPGRPSRWSESSEGLVLDARAPPNPLSKSR